MIRAGAVVKAEESGCYRKGGRQRMLQGCSWGAVLGQL